MLESITIREAFPRSTVCGGDQKRVEEIKSVWRRSRACGGDQESVEEIKSVWRRERASCGVGDTEKTRRS